MPSAPSSALPVLLSMAFATIQDDESSDASKSKKSSALEIKNTFLNIPDEAPKTYRRSSSAPPSCRNDISTSDRWAERQDLADKENNSSSSSTVDPSEGEGGLSEEDAQSPTRAQSLLGQTLSQVPEPQLQVQRLFRSRMSSQARSWCPAEYVSMPQMPLDYVPLPQVACCQPPIPPQTMNPAAQPNNLPADVWYAFAEVAQAVETVLQAFGYYEISECAGKWSYIAHIDPSRCTEVLHLVGEALLEAARKSKNTYVLGFETNPFTPLPMGFGFSAQLGIVPDPSKACWSVIQNGFCCKGTSCRWRHPSWNGSVQIQLA